MDSLRRPVPIIQFVPAMGVPVELNDPPQLQTAPPARGLQTSRFGLLPTRRRKAPQRAEQHLAYDPRQTWRLEYCRLLTHQNNNPRISKPTVAQPFLAVLASNSYSATACGFCPACRAKPVASR